MTPPGGTDGTGTLRSVGAGATGADAAGAAGAGSAGVAGGTVRGNGPRSAPPFRRAGAILLAGSCDGVVMCGASPRSGTVDVDTPADVGGGTGACSVRGASALAGGMPGCAARLDKADAGGATGAGVVRAVSFAEAGVVRVVSFPEAGVVRAIPVAGDGAATGEVRAVVAPGAMVAAGAGRR